MYRPWKKGQEIKPIVENSKGDRMVEKVISLYAFRISLFWENLDVFYKLFYFYTNHINNVTKSDTKSENNNPRSLIGFATKCPHQFSFPIQR